MPSSASARPTWVRPALVDRLAGLRGVEIVAAAVGVEAAEQALPGDRLDEPAKARRRAFLLHQEHRVDRAGGVIHGDDQVERRLPDQPFVG